MTAPQICFGKARAISSAPASPARRPPGRSRIAGVRVVLHEMRPQRMTEAHRTEALAELVCLPTPFAPTTPPTMAGPGCCTAENAPAGLADHALGPMPTRYRPAARLAVDRERLFSAAVTQALEKSPADRKSTAPEVAGLPPGRSGRNVIVADRPPSPRRRWRMRSANSPTKSALAFFDAIAPDRT